jgi:hypothetical protein
MSDAREPRLFSTDPAARRAWLNQLDSRIERYIPPELRPLLGLAAEITPSRTLERGALASEALLDPETESWDRLGAAGDLLSETVGVAAFPVALGRLGRSGSEVAQELLAGASVAPRSGSDSFGQGWQDVYHWSRAPDAFDEFRPELSRETMSRIGPHVGTPAAAEARFLGRGDSDGDGLGFTLPLRADLSKPFVNPKNQEPWSELDLNLFVSQLADEHDIPRAEVAALLRERLAREGYTHIPYVNDVEDVGSLSHIMLVDRAPGQDAVLRSRFADFDPAKAQLPNLLAGAAGAAALPLAATDDDPGFQNGGEVGLRSSTRPLQKQEPRSAYRIVRERGSDGRYRVRFENTP